MNATLQMGSHGDKVKQLQQLLNSKLNLNPKLVEDGVFGVGTDKALKRFQAVNSLGIDGVAGPKTWSVLTANSPVVKPKPTVVATPNAPWMQIAKTEEGQEEIKGSTHNARVLEYHASTTLKATTDETPWCSSFVNWALNKAGIKGTNSAAAISWVNWGKTIGPTSGAVAVIYNAKAANSSLSSSGNHVGFLVQETATHYVLLGGNQGDMVKVSFFPKSSWALKGYRWPN